MENRKMASRKDIATMVLRILGKDGLVIEGEKSGNGYFLFDFGEDSVWHFKVKGAKRWRCGLWVINSKEGDDSAYNVSLFMQHEDYIDKFKPSYSPISCHFTLDLDSIWNECKERGVGDMDKRYDENLDWKIKSGIHDVKEKMEDISLSPVIMKYAYYNNITYGDYWGKKKGFLAFIVSEWWFYRVVEPYKSFMSYTGSYYKAKFWSFVLRMRYRGLRCEVKRFPRNFSPSTTLALYYDNYDEDRVYDIYHSGLVRRVDSLNWKSYGNSFSLVHYRTKDDKRGFYYKAK